MICSQISQISILSSTVVLEKTLDGLLDCKEIQPIYPKGNQSWVFIGRTDAEAEAPVLWSPDAKNWLIWEDPDAGNDWRWEEKGMTEDEMVGWHHLLNGHEFEQAPGAGDGQGSLECCSPWGCKELEMTERLNWTELKQVISKDRQKTILRVKIFFSKKELKYIITTQLFILRWLKKLSYLWLPNSAAECVNFIHIFLMEWDRKEISCETIAKS